MVLSLTGEISDTGREDSTSLGHINNGPTDRFLATDPAYHGPFRGLRVSSPHNRLRLSHPSEATSLLTFRTNLVIVRRHQVNSTCNAKDHYAVLSLHPPLVITPFLISL